MGEWKAINVPSPMATATLNDLAKDGYQVFSTQWLQTDNGTMLCIVAFKPPSAEPKYQFRSGGSL